MPEEFRFFLRTGVWILIAGVAYWLLSYEAAGSVLLGALLLAIVAFIVIGRVLGRGGGAKAAGAWVSRVIGFAEPAVVEAPLESGPEVAPLGSPWPVVTAAAIVLVGLGLVFGPWLIVPGVALLVIGGIGWLTQLDSA